MYVLDKTLFFSAIAVLVSLAFLILYGKNGYMDQRELAFQEQMIINENNVIDMKNRVFERKIERLKSDLSYIEHIARHELGMLAEDELVFIFQSARQPVGVNNSSDIKKP